MFVIVSTSPTDGLWPDQRSADSDGGACIGPFATASEARAFLADNRSAWSREPTILPVFSPPRVVCPNCGTVEHWRASCALTGA